MTTTAAPDRLLSAAEVAAIIGMSKRWVEEQARADEIPHVPLGRFIKFRREDVDAWIAEQVRGG